jgi:hypothetical protein
MNGALGLIALTFGTVVAGFVTLFGRQEDATKEAIYAAKAEARATMLEYQASMLKTLMEQSEETAIQAVKLVRDEQGRIFAAQKDPDVVTPRRMR